MEYIRAVLVQIPADKIEEASRPRGLLAELDQHRSLLDDQPGFRGMRVTRSLNPEGDVLLVVETRWQDEGALRAYGAREPNAVSIINQHQELIVPGSLQVEDMEAVRAAPGQAREVQDRLALPLLVPLGAFVFAVLLVYGLSRIYLEVPTHVATPLALGISVGILLVAWYLASTPRVPRWQIGGIVTVAVALLLGGGIFAGVHEEGGETAAAESPTPAASPVPGGAAVSIAMVPSISFDTSELTMAANQDVTIEADNRDDGIPHNFAVYSSRDDAEAGEDALGATPICNAPCTEEVTLNLPPGEYFFRCDVHPDQMTGNLVVEEGAGPAPGGEAPEPAAVLPISAQNVAFDTDLLEAPADQPFVIEFENKEPLPHNVAIYTDESAAEPLFVGEIFSGPDSRTYEIPALPAGEYFFRCDVHATTMTGTLVVQ